MVKGVVWGKGDFGLLKHISEIGKFWGEDDRLFLLLGS